MIRTYFLTALVFAWIIFIFFGKKDRFDYLSTSISAALPGEVLDWRSEKLYFDGWSLPEPTHRWSNTSQPTVCFKPQLNPHASDGAISLTFSMTMVEPLIGQLIPVLVDGKTVTFKAVQGQQNIIKYQNPINIQKKMICATFKLPLTVKIATDTRNLGISFKSLVFNYTSESGET